mmetsp:Transcript_2036/g.4590  ORF Transcript_2036/g.4590 Transcript_2036/m.4590 type:complete len:2326 (+) Transcript_2036:22-6999(+)
MSTGNNKTITMKRQLSNKSNMKSQLVLKRGRISFLRRSIPLFAIFSAMFPFIVQHTTYFGSINHDTSYETVQERIKNPKIRRTDLTNNAKAAPKTRGTKIVHNSTIKEWSNDRNIVHVIYSRFMQHQPNLLELGLARLQLFKTICLPTIKQQTNQQFLWIIRTDPELHPTLKENLLEELQDLPNVAVVGSNEIKKGSLDDGFRGEDAIGDITPYSLFLGSMDLVQSYHLSTRKNSVLETNLDADDGLGLSFVETAQKMTESRFHGNKRRTAWFNLCVGRHLEWQYFAPWDNTTDKGSLNLGSTHICVTAGLSWAAMAKAEPEFTEAHHLIKKETKDCREVSSKRKHLGCWAELPDGELLAIRARTPTSTGMASVLTPESEWTQDQVDAHNALWPLLPTSFGISQADIVASHEYLAEHMEDVVGDNLRGQCRKDHSCSEGIKKKLKKIIYKDRMWKNKFDVVHVIQTSIDSLLSANVLRQFSFDSLEGQTSYEFLWIIRVKEVSESQELNDFFTSKIVGKSPLNILVVQSDQTSTVNFRTPQAVVGISEETLLYGDMEIIEAFHEASQDRTLIETFLEPYDALSKTFVEEIQKSTVAQLETSQMMDDKNVWYYRCTSKFIEWNYFTPEGYDRDAGFLSLGGSDDKQCVENPGVTRISRPGAEIPYSSDATQISECHVLVVLQINSGCYAPMFSNETLTARAIIPESVEKPVPRQVEANDLELLDEEDKHLRSVLRDSVNIYPSAVETMRSYIQKTQCSDSRTCNVEWDSEHGVTHVIQTALKDESSFLYWRYFCLSLETQTTNKFLWIIRVSLDSALMEKLMKVIRNISLNVIVVKSTFSPEVSFRHAQAIEDIHNETLAYGDMTLLQYFHLSAQRRPLLETFLTPTEALSKQFVVKLQQSAAGKARGDNGVKNQDSWYYRCVSQFVEWRAVTSEDTLFEAGKASLANPDTEMCMHRPGTTRISLPGADIPSGDWKRTVDRACGGPSGWFQSGCSAPMREGMKAARVATTQTEGQLPAVVNATAFLEQQKGWYDFLREDFGIYRMSLLQLVSKTRRQALSSAPTVWQNHRKIVHVVYSRFMQQQGTLMQLGVARLKLMKTLCVPSVLEQTNNDFLWVIRTDPELLPELKEDLIETLKGIPNVVLVASDVAVDGFSDGSFRKDSTMDEFRKQSILLGDLNLLWSYHEASKSNTLVETNLDTDDGIALTFVESVQSHVRNLFYMDRDQRGWLQICISRHMEWHVYSPWEKRSNKGCMLPGKARSCIKSGLSWATQPKSMPEFSKELHNLKEYVARCYVGNSTEKSLFKGCWDSVQRQDPENDVVAIRSMTPASFGLAKGTISSFDWGIKSLLFDKSAWSLLDPYFSIRPAEVKDLRKHLVDNQEQVNADNERSKCTHERTCAGKWKNKHKVVHVILTDLHDPNLSDPWHRVSLSSLTRQSTYEFLWIIRVADFTDSRIVETILTPMEESPFKDNIMVVKSAAFSLESFRSPQSIADISESSLVHGNMTMIHDYHQASQTRPLLETYLKAAEGLTRTYVDEIQVSASLWARENSASDSDMWYYQCVPEYMETSYRTPRGDFVEKVFLRTIGLNESKCVDRPGTTRVSLPGSKIGVDTLQEVQACGHDNSTARIGCFIQAEALKTLALRFRLPSEVQEHTSWSESEIVALEKQQMRFVMQLRLQYSVFPPTLTAMNRLIADNERQIVHVIHTWIPDQQSILTWRQFSIDTLIKQDSQNFVWIIRTNITDADVIKGISYPIRFNYDEPDNIFLVRSSGKSMGVDFRKPEALAEITEQTIVRGKLDNLRNQQKAAQGRTVIETYLSPTDNLSTGFVRAIQNSVTSAMRSNNWVGHQTRIGDKTNEKESWYFQCTEEYLEWTFFSPQGGAPKAGFLSMKSATTNGCVINPGASRISLPGSEVPYEINFSGIKSCTSFHTKGCSVPFTSKRVLAARVVIPESVENAPSAPSARDRGKQMPDQKELLSVMTTEFGMGPSGLEIMRTEMHKLKCSEVGGCSSRWESKYGVTHVMYTTLLDPMSTAVWRLFTFALEQQTSNKFLYIIRVSPSKDILNEVIKPCIKTPLNIILVKSTSDPTMNYNFRQPEAIAELNANTIVTLNSEELEMLKHFYESAQNSTLVETFLEPGDALKSTFAMEIQEFTAHHIKKQQTPNLYYQCSPTHWEWTYYTPDGHDMDFGSLEIVDANRTKCMDRPGKTRISLPGTKLDGFFQGSSKPCTDSSIENGCYLPMKFSDSNKVPYGARVIIPESLKDESSVPHQHDDIATANHIQRQMEVFKKDFSVKPLPLKQMKQKIKKTLEQEFNALEKKSKRQLR